MARQKVFISSVIRGYEQYRSAAKQAVIDLGHEPVTAEDFPASTTSPRVACLKGVRESEIYVGLFGRRFSEPTRDEYNEAKPTGKQMLIFVESGARDPEQATFVKTVGDLVDLAFPASPSPCWTHA